MRITALLENTTERPDMLVEHGLSLYIESDGRRILFDMGASELFYENAKTLGIDLSLVDFAVLSHGHYDHGGGLRKFLEINTHAPVYMSKDAFCAHYNGTEKYIGLDGGLKGEKRIIFTESSFKIDGGAELFYLDTEGDSVYSGLTVRVGESFIPDDFRHEQYLMIEENGRRVLFSGCSHRGILAISKRFPADVVVGGFHYSKRELSEPLADAARELASRGADFYTAHCTGREQFEFMRRYMPTLRYLACGDSITL